MNRRNLSILNKLVNLSKPQECCALKVRSVNTFFVFAAEKGNNLTIRNIDLISHFFVRSRCSQIQPKPEFKILQGDFFAGVDQVSILIEGGIEGKQNITEKNDVDEGVPFFTDDYIEAELYGDGN